MDRATVDEGVRGCCTPAGVRGTGSVPVGIALYTVLFNFRRLQTGSAAVITGELKGKIDRVWDAFWSGGISNPLEVIEQITYLLFIRRLDDLNTLAEKKARLTGASDGVLFGASQQHLRWSKLKHEDPTLMHKIVADAVFPFLRGLGGDGSTYSEHMRDARFTIPTSQLLSRVVDLLDDIPMDDRDTNGDLYEYLLSKMPLPASMGSSVRRDTSSRRWSR